MNSTELVSCRAGMRGVVPTAVRRAELGSVFPPRGLHLKLGSPNSTPPAVMSSSSS